MSAANPGPLGLLEKEAVNALQNLLVAEGRRAEVLFKDGKVIRPMESAHPEFLGLLGELEKNTVTQLEKIRDAEITRASKFGPLTRPKDVPFSERSALSTVEEEAQTLVKAEVERLKTMLETGDVLVRPMDGEGVLGKAERGVVGTAETLLAYEKARLAQLKEQGYYMRPMETNPDSIAGKAEAVGVTFGTGLLRAPVMVGATIKRVTELLVSELGGEHRGRSVAVSHCRGRGRKRHILRPRHTTLNAQHTRPQTPTARREGVRGREGDDGRGASLERTGRDEERRGGVRAELEVGASPSAEWGMVHVGEHCRRDEAVGFSFGWFCMRRNCSLLHNAGIQPTSKRGNQATGCFN